jgi:hypothetical protein
MVLLVQFSLYAHAAGHRRAARSELLLQLAQRLHALVEEALHRLV